MTHSGTSWLIMRVAMVWRNRCDVIWMKGASLPGGASGGSGSRRSSCLVHFASRPLSVS